ncbi:MAG: putative capsid protein [Circoviridae sp.]|nr:MAG: putative capsid protein [Circoviridae sp.]
MIHMPRKYQGPLQPGKRSAKVPKGRKAPSRVRVSKERYTEVAKLSKQVSNLVQNKYQGYTLTCGATQPKPAGVQPISYFLYNAGETLTQPGNAPFNPMNLFQFNEGDSSTERSGDYMYIRRSHLKLELQMLPFASSDLLQGASSTTQFRLMVVKANRKYNKLGNSPIAGNSLFLTTENDEFGFGVAGSPSTANTFSNMSQPINKRKWLVYKDMHFTLSTPAQEYQDTSIPNESSAINTANPKYPVKKYVSINLPVYKKTHFDDTSNTPDSVDTQWLLIIQACRSNYCNPGQTAPRNISLNILGTTSAQNS